MTRPKERPDGPIDARVGALDEQTLRRLLASAAVEHDDVARAVRLAAAGEDERLQVLRLEVDRGLRTRRFLDYWASTEWGAEARPVVDALAEAVASSPSADLVKLLERAAGHLVKVIMRADDSNGVIGDLAGRVLELHCEACATGVAEPVPLAKWMVRFSFEDQDYFPIDPVAYAGALGDKGLAVYRREVSKRSAPVAASPEGSSLVRDVLAPFPSFAAKYTAERLAVLDEDIDRVVELLGGDLSSPYQFTRLAAAMVELGRAEDALAWAKRGLAETSGSQVAKLYDLAAGLLAASGETDKVVGLRRDQHARTPSAATYATFQEVARAAGCWDGEVAAARAVLAAGNLAGLIDALLADGDADEAWRVATTGDRELHGSQWLRLAQAREPVDPAAAMEVYLRLAGDALMKADKRTYRVAVRHLKAARRAADAAGRRAEFDECLAALREQHRRRPTFIDMLDKASLQ